MRRNKEKDDLHFNCSLIRELLDVASLYEEEPRVFAFLRQTCQYGKLRYSTYLEVYELIETEFGFPIPD